MAIHTNFRASTKLALLLLLLGLIAKAKAKIDGSKYCSDSRKLCLERCGEDLAFKCVDDGPGAQAVTCGCSSSTVETECTTGNCTASDSKLVASVSANASSSG